MLLALAAAAALAKFDFYASGPYESSVPRPDDLLGYAIGTRTTTFRDQERCLFSMAAAAGARMKVIEFGKSWEGRPLRLFVVSSPKNMSRLEEIRKHNLARANGESQNTEDPALVWVNECIHGDETASFESAMALLYNLAASRQKGIESALDKAVVLVNPCYNPDGHERYTVYYNSIATGSPEPGAFENSEPSTIYGRLNHYRFDLNRDRVAMSQVETREEVSEFMRWHPQVYIDQHGQVETYFFPPNAMSQNVNVDRKRVDKWTEIFGRATGKAFDREGWTYFVKDTFDLYYPGYLDAFTTLSGAIGMTHETDGGRLLASRRRDDTMLTLRDGAMKHFTAALAVVEAAAEHRAELLSNFVAFRRKAVTGEATGKFRRVVVDGDPRALARLSGQLSSAGIESHVAAAGWKQADAHDYWTAGNATAREFRAGSLVVDLAQPQAQLAKALLEPASDFESEFMKAQIAKKSTAPEGETYPGPEGTEFYDTTAWALPFAHNLRAWWCESAPPVRSAKPGPPRDFGQGQVGYALRYTDEDDALAVAALLERGIHASVTTKPMAVGSDTLSPGTFLVLRARNDGNIDPAIRDVAKRYDAAIVPIGSSYPESGRQGPGSENVIHLRNPCIGVVFGNGASMGQIGGIWFLMEQVWHLPFTPLSTDALGRDLSRYTCIVVPSGVGVTLSPKLREWVAAGGCLVALGGLEWALGGSGFVELQSVPGDLQELPGALVRAKIDPRSFLGFGYPDSEIAVPVEGSAFYKARREGGTVVTIDPAQKTPRVLSGWAWPQESDKALAGAAWLQDVPVGRGHAVLFTYDPTSRAMWPGLNRLLLNAMLIGASV